MVELDDLRLVHELREQGVDWESIKDTIVGFTDNDRKLYYGFKKGLESKEDVDLVKHAKTLQKIRLSRKQLGIERSINNEQIRDITLHKTFTNQVLDAIENRYVDFNIIKHDYEFDTKKAHIFSLADFHYDGDISYLENINHATSRIIDVIKEKELTHIYLLELGDIIEGASLRTSQLMAVKSGMINQLIDVVDAYIKMLTTLNEYVDITFISVDSSNHTQLRNLGTKQNQLVEEDLMLVFNKMIEKALPNLAFIHGDDVLINIAGFNMFIAHGHLVRSKEKYLETLQSDRNILIDYGFFGHFHHQRSIDLHSTGTYDKKVFYVPALTTKHSGYEKDKNLSSQAGVGYYVFDSMYGHVETRKLIIKGVEWK